MRFYSSCVSWPSKYITALSTMVDGSTEVCRRTFLKHVDRLELTNIEKALGYALHPKQGLTMASDWGVSYYKSKLHGKRVYFLLIRLLNMFLHS